MRGWNRPCACGAIVTADPLDPSPGVRAHVLGSTHREWSDRTSWAGHREAEVPTPHRATVPMTAERLRELLAAYSRAAA